MIDRLTTESVSIKTKVNGENFRRAYVNSDTGRAKLILEQPPETVSEIMAVWGDTPTIPDITPELQPSTLSPMAT